MNTRRRTRCCAMAAFMLAAIAGSTHAATPAATPGATAATTAAGGATSAPPSPTTTPAAPPATAATAATGAAAAPAGNAAPITRAAYRAALDRAATDYNRKRATCRSLKGNDRTVCIVEAKSEAKRAEAAAEAAYRNTARARMDARVIAANADYAVAKARCNAMSGAERRNCVKMAKDKQSGVITAAMRAPL